MTERRLYRILIAGLCVFVVLFLGAMAAIHAAMAQMAAR